MCIRGTIIGASNILSNLVLMTAFSERSQPHFKDEKTEARVKQMAQAAQAVRRNVGWEPGLWFLALKQCLLFTFSREERRLLSFQSWRDDSCI